MRATGQVRRIGVHLNQAVAALNAAGQMGGDLIPYASVCIRTVRKLDDLGGCDQRTARMIGKVTRGGRVMGLLYYLYGPGRANEHVNPHLAAGWRHPGCRRPAGPDRPGLHSHPAALDIR
ncbi:hypothetical protein GCM10023259_039410 [Thermocatellispora tengchongensis]